MLRISSAVGLVAGPRSPRRPTTRNSAFEIALTATMNGPNSHANAWSGRAVRSAIPSARRSAHIFGACSPSVM